MVDFTNEKDERHQHSRRDEITSRLPRSTHTSWLTGLEVGVNQVNDSQWVGMALSSQWMGVALSSQWVGMALSSQWVGMALSSQWVGVALSSQWVGVALSSQWVGVALSVKQMRVKGLCHCVALLYQNHHCSSCLAVVKLILCFL